MITEQTAPTAARPSIAAPPDFIYRMEATFTEIVPIGLVPEGLRIDAHYEGRVIEGPLAGSVVRGVDYLLIRPDGVSVLDIRQLITTGTEQQIAIRAQGYGVSEAETPLPSPEALRNAQFAWPDSPSHLLGVAFCQTAAPDFLWLNRTVTAFAGTVNLGTRKVDATGRALTPEMLMGPAVQ